MLCYYHSKFALLCFLLPQLNPFSADSRSLHEELRDVPSYLDYVAMSFLVCPCLLFQEEKFKDIFKAAATDHLVVTLFRDIVRFDISFIIARNLITLPSFSIEYQSPCRI